MEQVFDENGVLLSQHEPRTLQQAKDLKKKHLESEAARAMDAAVVPWEQYMLWCNITSPAETTAYQEALDTVHQHLDTLKAGVDACVTHAQVDAIVWSTPV